MIDVVNPRSSAQVATALVLIWPRLLPSVSGDVLSLAATNLSVSAGRVGVAWFGKWQQAQGPQERLA